MEDFRFASHPLSEAKRQAGGKLAAVGGEKNGRWKVEGNAWRLDTHYNTGDCNAGDMVIE